MKKIYLLQAIAISSVLFTSCLKDKEFEDGKIGVQDYGSVGKIIELPQALNSINHSPIVFALNTDPATEVIDAVEVNLATGQPAAEDITIKLKKNMTIVNDYNTGNGTNYVELPANAYTLPNNLDVVIPRGSQKGYLKINLLKSNFDFTQAYALGYSIDVVSPAGFTISQNYRNVMLSVGLKNKYDGKYLMTGYHNRPPAALPNYSSTYVDVPVEFHTAGASSVKFFWTEAGAYGHPFSPSPGVLNWYGTAIGPIYNMDATSNAVTSASNGGGSTPIDLALALNPNPRFTWNAATNKPDKAYIAIRYLANNARAFIDTFTYVGPR